MKLKRIAASVLAAVMVVMTMAMTVSASVFTDAKSISNGKKASETLKTGASMAYKFTPTSKGTAKVKVTAEATGFYFYVYDADGNDVEFDYDISMGSKYSKNEFQWNKNAEAFKGTFSFDVKAKKTYYVQIMRWKYSSGGNGKFAATFTYPSSSSSSDDSTFLTCTVKKGGTVQLGSTDDSAKWSSSNKSVATVSSSGVIKGVKKGEAVITVKGSSQTLKIKVIVTA